MSLGGSGPRSQGPRGRLTHCEEKYLFSKGFHTKSKIDLVIPSTTARQQICTSSPYTERLHLCRFVAQDVAFKDTCHSNLLVAAIKVSIKDRLEAVIRKANSDSAHSYRVGNQRSELRIGVSRRNAPGMWASLYQNSAVGWALFTRV